MIEITNRKDRGVTEIMLGDLGIHQDTAEIVETIRGVKRWSHHATPGRIRRIGFWDDIHFPVVPIEAKGKKRARDLSEKRWVYTNSAPLRQIIYDYLKEREAKNMLVKTDSIVDEIFYVEPIYPDEPLYHRIVENTIESMHRKGQILRSRGGYWKSGDPLPRGKPVAVFEPGYNPVHQRAIWFVRRGSGKAACKFRDLLKYLGEIGWIKRKATLLRILNKEMSKNLEETAPGTYSFKAPLEEIRVERAEGMVTRH